MRLGGGDAGEPAAARSSPTFNLGPWPWPRPSRIVIAKATLMARLGSSRTSVFGLYPWRISLPGWAHISGSGHTGSGDSV